MQVPFWSHSRIADEFAESWGLWGVIAWHGGDELLGDDVCYGAFGDYFGSIVIEEVHQFRK